MFPWWQKKRMIGGLYFGPAGWVPEEWEKEQTKPAEEKSEQPQRYHIPLRGHPPHSALPTLPTFPVEVKYGEVLEAGTGGDADIVATVAGKWVGLEKIEQAGGNGGWGGVTTAAVIETVGTPEKAEVEGEKWLEKVDVREARQLLARAGMGTFVGHQGPGGAGLLAQLADLDGRPPGVVMLNFVALQPESRLPFALATMDLERMLAGVKWLKGVLGTKQWVAIMDRMEFRGLRQWRRELRQLKIKTRWVLNQYPKGHPTILLWTQLGLRLSVGALPTRAKGTMASNSEGGTGVLVIDPVTLWELGGLVQGWERVVRERPIEIFVAGKKPILIKGTIGEKFTSLLGRYGIDLTGKQCIVNGMLTGVDIDGQQGVVEETTAMISVRELPETERATDCIQCGWCLDHCPTGLNPQKLSQLAGSKNGTMVAEASEALNCIGCGLCGYVCPTRLPLLQDVLGLRGAMRRDLQARLQSEASLREGTTL